MHPILFQNRLTTTYAVLRHEAGYRTASYDRDFNMKAMDFLSPAGFLPLDRYYLSELGCPIPTALHLATHHLRLALWVVARMPINSLSVMAPDCSSWGIPARGSSKRNFINSSGQIFSAWVRGANTMVSRNLGT